MFAPRFTSRSASSTWRRWRAERPWSPRRSAASKKWSFPAKPGCSCRSRPRGATDFEPRDPEQFARDLAAAMDGLLSDPDLRRQMGQRSREARRTPLQLEEHRPADLRFLSESHQPSRRGFAMNPIAPRVVIEGVDPEIDGGLFPIKRHGRRGIGGPRRRLRRRPRRARRGTPLPPSRFGELDRGAHDSRSATTAGRHGSECWNWAVTNIPYKHGLTALPPGARSCPRRRRRAKTWRANCSKARN